MGELAFTYARVHDRLLSAALNRGVVSRLSRFVGFAYAPNALGFNRRPNAGPDSVQICVNPWEQIDQAAAMLRALGVPRPSWYVSLPASIAGLAQGNLVHEIAHNEHRRHDANLEALYGRLLDLADEVGLRSMLDAGFRRILMPEAIRELAEDYTDLRRGLRDDC